MPFTWSHTELSYDVPHVTPARATRVYMCLYVKVQRDQGHEDHLAKVQGVAHGGEEEVARKA